MIEGSREVAGGAPFWVEAYAYLDTELFNVDEPGSFHPGTLQVIINHSKRPPELLAAFDE
jgi:hypothetical protein